jgi:hypothetical protein
MSASGTELTSRSGQLLDPQPTLTLPNRVTEARTSSLRVCWPLGIENIQHGTFWRSLSRASHQRLRQRFAQLLKGKLPDEENGEG